VRPVDLYIGPVHWLLVVRAFQSMARRRDHSTSPDHELLLHDYQGQEKDHERQDGGNSSAENDKRSEDGGKKRDFLDIYPRGLATLSADAHREDIESKHQDHHPFTLNTGDTKKNSFDYPSGPLHVDNIQVRRSLFILDRLSYLLFVFILHLLLLLFSSFIESFPPAVLHFSQYIHSFILGRNPPTTFFVIVIDCDCQPSLPRSL
jgi:hypothetical protein